MEAIYILSAFFVLGAICLIINKNNKANENEDSPFSHQDSVAMRYNALSETHEAAINKNIKIQNKVTIDLFWVDWPDLIASIEDSINIPNSKKWVDAISLSDGNVYVKITLIYEILRKQALEKNITEKCSYLKGNTEDLFAVTYSVAEYFRQHKAIAASVRRPFFGRRFKLVDDAYDMITAGFYLPLKIDLFDISIEELEKRKLNIGWLNKIKIAIPIDKKRRMFHINTSTYEYGR